MTYVPGSFFCASDTGIDSRIIRAWSRFTRWCEGRGWRKATWDHCGVIVGVDGETIEARASGLGRYSIRRYEGGPSRVKIWTPRGTDVQAAVAREAETVFDVVGEESYPFLQTFVGIPLTWIARRRPVAWVMRNVFRCRRIRNPFGAGINCVELDVTTARRANMPIPINGMDENTEPERFAEWADGLNMIVTEVA